MVTRATDTERPPGTEEVLPLAGIRILDLTHALAGPFATMILGDLGADIIKVESPRGDMTRTTPPLYINGMSLYFLTQNRNKRSVVINLKDEKGKEIFADLVRVADVVIYNFSHGVVDRLEIDHHTLVQINPQLITCSITGFGVRGPEANRPAVDLVVQAMAGAMSLTGEQGRPPVRCGVPTGDLSAGLYAVVGILAALQRRETTGRGSQVETSLFHSQLSLLNYSANYTLATGEILPPMGTRHINNAAAEAFPTSDGWVAIDASFDHHFAKLCDTIGRPSYRGDPRFIDRKNRVKNRDELTRLIAAETCLHPTVHWLSALGAMEIPCGPVNSVSDAIQHPQAQAYESLRSIPYEDRTFQALATPLWFGGATEQPMAAPPRLGEHTASVLRETLQYSENEISELVDIGAIVTCEQKRKG